VLLMYSTRDERWKLRVFFLWLLILEIDLGGGYLEGVEGRGVLLVGQKLCDLLDPTSKGGVFDVHDELS
jgi:hypothetical protein